MSRGSSGRRARRGARAIAVAASAVALVQLPGPSYADQQILRDPRGDVWRVWLGTGEAQPARGEDQDLRGGFLRHGTAAVTVQWRYAALRPRGPLVVHRALLRNGAGATWEVRIDAGAGYRRGRAAVFSADDRRVACATTHRIDGSRRIATLVVPRTCLGEPLFVQARLDAFRGDRDGSFRRDNLHDREPQTSRWTRLLAPA